MTDPVTDHVLYAVRNLDDATAKFLDTYGLASVAGGRHPGHGTVNRIIPLGPDYIELIAVVDTEEAAASPLGSRVLAGVEGWIGHALRADRLEDHLDDGDEVVAMSRTRPDGVELSWRIAHFGRFLDGGGAPFLIQWDVPVELLPGRTMVEHRVRPTGIVRIDFDGSGIGAVAIGLADGGELVI